VLLVVLASLVLIPLAVGKPAGAPGESAIAEQSESAGDSLSAEPTASEPAWPVNTESPGPSASPTPTPGITGRPPQILASIDCVFGDDLMEPTPPIEDNGRLYIACGHDIKAIDLATSKVVKTYKSVLVDDWSCPAMAQCGPGTWTFVIDHGLWVDGKSLRRIDLDSGKVTVELPNYEIAGDALGYLWARQWPGEGYAGFKMMRIDPSSGKIEKEFHADAPLVACDAVWDMKAGGLARLNLDGSVLWSLKNVDYYPIAHIDGTCWATVDTHDAQGEPTGWHLVQVGQSCDAWRSPSFFGYIVVFGGTFWLTTHPDPENGDVTNGRQIDPATWQVRGDTWALPWRTFYAGGHVWGWIDDRITKLDIPIEPWTYNPGSSRPCPTIAPSPSTSPAPSAAPSKAPTATPAAS
jgi:hypothetical protein